MLASQNLRKEGVGICCDRCSSDAVHKLDIEVPRSRRGLLLTTGLAALLPLQSTAAEDEATSRGSEETSAVPPPDTTITDQVGFFTVIDICDHGLDHASLATFCCGNSCFRNAVASDGQKHAYEGS